MARKLLFALLVVLFPSVLMGQVTATIRDVPGTAPADAYDIAWMAAYSGDVVYKADIYAAWWQGAGPSNPSGTWSWFSQPSCADPQHPDANFPECNDRVVFGWKHLSCAIGGACGSNNNWNIYPGTSNYPATNYHSWKYLGMQPTPIQSGATHASAHSFPINRRYLPPLGNPNGTQYTGAGGPAVVYANGRWFMAYDQNVLHFTGMNADTHRIAWATSTNGANWTYWGIIARDISEETLPNAGLLVTDLYFENNVFYMLVTSIQTSQIYLMKANYSAAGIGFDGWSLPTGKDPNNNLIYPGSPNVNPDVPVDFSAYQPLLKDLSGFIPSATVSKVHASPTSPLYRYVFLVDMSPSTDSSVCASEANSYPLRLYTSPTLTAFQTSYSNIGAAQNSSRFRIKGGYGWTPEIPFLVPDPPGGLYTQVYNPVSLFVDYCDTASPQPNENRNNIGRVQLVLSGDIY